MQSGGELPKANVETPVEEPAVESAPIAEDKSEEQESAVDPVVEPTSQMGGGETEVETPVQEKVPAPDENPSEPEAVVLDLPVGPQVGYFAPDFSLQTPDGSIIQLSDLRGRPVVVSYWASWCGPCKNEMQILQNVFQQYQDDGFTVVAVNAIEQDSLNKVTEMVSQLGVTYPIVLDHGNQFADDYNALFFPTTYFIDSNGVIQDLALGDSPEEQFHARVSTFLANQ
jgi:peroxiredoxin